MKEMTMKKDWVVMKKNDWMHYRACITIGNVQESSGAFSLQCSRWFQTSKFTT